MTAMIAIHHVVRVVRDVPEQGVAKGMTGAVIEAFGVPERAYEVEFVDAEGRTVLQATLVEEDLEVVSNGESGTS
jgi:hypothetical protein